MEAHWAGMRRHSRGRTGAHTFWPFTRSSGFEFIASSKIFQEGGGVISAHGVRVMVEPIADGCNSASCSLNSVQLSWSSPEFKVLDEADRYDQSKELCTILVAVLSNKNIDL